MKIGVMVMFTENTPRPAAIAAECEAMGFDSIFVPEHVAIPPGDKKVEHANLVRLNGGFIPETYAHTPDQFVALSTAAAATMTIKLGTGICWAARHHPLSLAKMIASPPGLGHLCSSADLPSTEQ